MRRYDPNSAETNEEYEFLQFMQRRCAPSRKKQRRYSGVDTAFFIIMLIIVIFSWFF